MREIMKKIIYLLTAFILITNSAHSASLEGGVKFDVDSARDYLKENQINSIEITGPFKFEAKNTQKVVYSYNNSGDIIGITVQYINEPDRAYIYGRNKQLLYVDNYDKSVNVYPHRGYRYNLDGKLILTSLTVSKLEQFRFSPDGSLIAHSIKGVIYDENGNVIGKAK